MLVCNEQQMLSFASKLARMCESPLIIHLSGQLGAGKTTFCRGFLTALGHKGRVKSPTYTLVEEYNVNNLQIFHFDLYRIHSEEELELIGIREYFHSNSLCLIEWPEQGGNSLPPADIKIAFSIEGDKRCLEFSSYSTKGAKIINAMESNL